MSFLTPGHMQCTCELGCVCFQCSQICKCWSTLQGQACSCCIQVSGNGCAVHSERNQALKAERRALKALLTPASSADHHLVPVLVVLPSYRTVLHPCLSESSKCCCDTDTMMKTLLWRLLHWFVNNVPAILISVIFWNQTRSSSQLKGRYTMRVLILDYTNGGTAKNLPLCWNHTAYIKYWIL